MKPAEIVAAQLKQLYEAIDRQLTNRMTIKNWCLTTWLAVIVYLVSKDATALTATHSYYALSLIPPILFWLLESMQVVLWIELLVRAEEREKFLLKSANATEDEQKKIFLAGFKEGTFSLRTKISVMLRALFSMETVYLFYLLLALAGVSVIYFVK